VFCNLVNIEEIKWKRNVAVVEMVGILFCSNRRPFDISTGKFASLIYSFFPHINLPLIVHYSPWWTLESHNLLNMYAINLRDYEIIASWNITKTRIILTAKVKATMLTETEVQVISIMTGCYWQSLKSDFLI
jgi:hypothetical protein